MIKGREVTIQSMYISSTYILFILIIFYILADLSVKVLL